MTLRIAAEAWLAQRKQENVPSVAAETQRLRSYVLPAFGDERVVSWRPKKTLDLVKHLKAFPSKRGGKLASRTIRQAYFTVRQVFQDLFLQEVILGNPIFVAKKALPKITDKFPGWRHTAVFTVAEVESLISDPRIAVHRRVAYAIEFLTGLRTGQASALKWGDYDQSMQPLGRLVSAFSWDSKAKIRKATKTEVTHEVPVHPVLAKVLAGWKLAGWKGRMKRQPKSDDLIIPTINNTHRDVRKALEDFHEDLDRLGLRRRRHYDCRRTFISIGIDSGASKDLLQSITHPRPVDAFDQYRSASWAARCEAVMKLKIELREGTLIALPQKAVGLGHGVLTECRDVAH